MLRLGAFLGHSMRKLFFAPLFLVSLSFGSEFVVVASSSFKESSLTKKQLRDIFLKKKSFIGSDDVVAVNLSASEKARISFEEKVLEMDRGELVAYWSNQHYQGITPPVTQKSQAGIKAFIKSVKGAIGYIEKKALEPDMKVLYEF